MLIRTNRNIIHLHCVQQERDATLSSDPEGKTLAHNFKSVFTKKEKKKLLHSLVMRLDSSCAQLL